MRRYADIGPCPHCAGGAARLLAVTQEPSTKAMLAEFSCQTCGSVRYFSITQAERRALMETDE